MKLIKEDGQFQPFNLHIKVETLGEAKTLYHVFNKGGLARLIEKGKFYDMDRYNLGLEDLNTMEVFEYIRDKIGKEKIFFEER